VKNIDLELPRDRLFSLASLVPANLPFDTIFAEGQRYVGYARQFLEQLDKPDVEAIEGLSPAISIDQNPPPIILALPLATKVMTICGCYLGEEPHCPICDRSVRLRQ